MITVRLFTKSLIAVSCGLCFAGCGSQSATISDFSSASDPSRVHFTKSAIKNNEPAPHVLESKGRNYTLSRTRAEQLARAYQRVLLAKLRPQTVQVRIDKIILAKKDYQVRYTSLTTSNKARHERVTFYYNGLITMAAKDSAPRNTGLCWH
ncbi:hypothetical protein [Lacticaseibacillus zhaodongensis]|uniref:hypothetical protein n=1 Tax=Lacticaseibacillus zhaodongensis TaxID=2668065 RepID=UPI0012D32113|nr:hypothetical protein [Lacticaseibacillus zhaodongensis]